MACDYPGHSLRNPGKCPGCSPTRGTPNADAIQAAVALEVEQCEARLVPVPVEAQAPVEIPPPVPAHEILWAFGVKVVSGAEANIGIIRLDGGRLTAGLTWVDAPTRSDLDDLASTLAVELFKARGVPSDE